MRAADKIIERTKRVANNTIIHLLRTESGDTFRVIQILHKEYYSESIYFVKNKIPILMRQEILLMSQVEIRRQNNFEDFVQYGPIEEN